MKYAPYSYSKMSCWNSCAKKFYFQYIAKVKVDKPQIHLQRGKLVHGLIEAIIKNSVKDYNIKQFNLEKEDIDRSINIVKSFCSTPNFRSIAKQTYYKFTEHEFLLNNSLNPTFDKKSALLKGFIDLICVKDNDILKIFDWKTGGKSIANISAFPLSEYQFEVYALYALQKYEMKNCICYYGYVEHDHFVEFSFDANDIERIKSKVFDNINSIETDTEFKKTINKLCDYCDFKELCKPITLTPAAIDRLLESDPETALEIKQGIANEFAKRFIKDLVDVEIHSNMRQEVENFVYERINSWTINVNPALKKLMVNVISAEADKIISKCWMDKVAKLREDIDAYIDKRVDIVFQDRLEKFENRVKQISQTEISENINEIADVVFRKMVGSLNG